MGYLVNISGRFVSLQQNGPSSLFMVFLFEYLHLILQCGKVKLYFFPACTLVIFVFTMEITEYTN